MLPPGDPRYELNKVWRLDFIRKCLLPVPQFLHIERIEGPSSLLHFIALPASTLHRVHWALVALPFAKPHDIIPHLLVASVSGPIESAIMDHLGALPYEPLVRLRRRIADNQHVINLQPVRDI